MVAKPNQVPAISISVIGEQHLMPLNLIVQSFLRNTERLTRSGNASILLAELVLNKAAFEMADLF